MFVECLRSDLSSPAFLEAAKRCLLKGRGTFWLCPLSRRNGRSSDLPPGLQNAFPTKVQWLMCSVPELAAHSSGTVWDSHPCSLLIAVGFSTNRYFPIAFKPWRTACTIVQSAANVRFCHDIGKQVEANRKCAAACTTFLTDEEHHTLFFHIFAMGLTTLL